MKRAKVVIGANFGDEGKGLITDYLAHQARTDTLVVRFNGGAQAGHTVVTPAGLRHVFHHFGAGTLSGARTFLSQFFVTNPILFMQEAERLMALDLGVRVFVDSRCFVTTPYDMLINQIVEDARARRRHGSCGVGFNETIERSQHPEYTITAGMLGDRDDLADTLRAIRVQWLPRRLMQLGNPRLSEVHGKVLADDATYERFMHACHLFRNLMVVERDRSIFSIFKNVIFEGAQGLLLDQASQWHPHVTRSNTGLRNVLDLAQEGGITDLDVTYVTRAYMTRHGAGPFPTEHKGAMPLYDGIVDATNVEHPYQGDLRLGLLDIDLLHKSVRRDIAIASATNVRARPNMAVTCMDQVGDMIAYASGTATRSRNPIGFLDEVEAAVGIPVRYVSSGPTRRDVVKMDS